MKGFNKSFQTDILVCVRVCVCKCKHTAFVPARTSHNTLAPALCSQDELDDLPCVQRSTRSFVQPRPQSRAALTRNTSVNDRECVCHLCV